MNIDTSSLTAHDISADEFSSDLYGSLQKVLQAEFPTELEKQRIKKTTTGYNFACPYCHDSATDSHKKRGHLLIKGKFAGRFKCFNCGKGASIPKFFTDFKHPMELNDLAYLRNHVITPENWYNNQNGNVITSEVINKEEVAKFAINRTFLKNILGLYEIDRINTPLAYSYLVNRCQYQFHRFLFSPKYNQILILNLIDNDNIIGFQVRPIGKFRAGQKYLTMSLSKMRERILNDKNPVPEYMNNLSTVFNIFNVNIYKPILVTEGPFDAFLLPNCIATSGANKHLGVEFPFWYVYDSDKTGKQHALAALKQGYNVFLWKKLIMDLGLPNREKWDVNDVIIWLKQQNREDKINWGIYFSSNPLDGLNI